MPERSEISYEVILEFFEDMISEGLGIPAFSHNEEITETFWHVLCGIAEHKCTDEISTELGIDPNYVELIQYLICNNDNAEYGISPRCCWLTKKGKRLYSTLEKLHKHCEEAKKEISLEDL